MKQRIFLIGTIAELVLLFGIGIYFYAEDRISDKQRIRDLKEVWTEESIHDSSMDNEEWADIRRKKTDTEQKKYIKWVDFNVSCEALCKAYEIDLNSHENVNKDAKETSTRINWVDVLSYAAARTGGEFGKKALSYMEEFEKERLAGKKISELTGKLEYYPYYREAYGAVLDGLVGEYEVCDDNGRWEKRYGLKGFSPIAKGFDYSDYDDFGVSRSFGYRRQHLGHDMMGLIGTPIIAVESGTVEALGWNQYGGWRIGIRSDDRKRYYYYAHLRQNRPYAEDLEEGSRVTAGDVIGYMGHTGYSSKENVNNIDTTHLHFGLELIFDECQKDSNNEIWVDCYALTRFLAKNRSECVRNEETKEWSRKYEMRE